MKRIMAVDPLVGEILAAIHAAELAIQRCWNRVIFETDSKLLREDAISSDQLACWKIADAVPSLRSAFCDHLWLVFLLDLPQAQPPGESLSLVGCSCPCVRSFGFLLYPFAYFTLWLQHFSLVTLVFNKVALLKKKIIIRTQQLNLKSLYFNIARIMFWTVWNL